MIFSYNLLQSFFDKKLPTPQKLTDLLIMHSFEVEKMEKQGNDWMLDIDVLSNRAADCFSHLGMARECAAIADRKLVVNDRKIKKNKELSTKKLIKVSVEDKRACPRYTARVISNIKVGPSPKWMQERLIVCGLRPINNIVDAANYVMLETGQPLHAFDLDKVFSSAEQRSIIVRQAAKGEHITTLDEERYDLDEDVLIIADEKTPLAIAGIKGGKKAEISQTTKTIIVESANFNYQTIRAVSRKLTLRTDASLRFEHSLDPNLAQFALERITALIEKTAGGTAAEDIIDVYPQKTLPKRIKLDLNYVQQLLGTKITVKEMIKILRSLEFKIVSQKQNQELMVEVPTFRVDVSIPEDLIEEIGRIYGYENIEAAFPIAVLVPPKRNEDLFWENSIKEILKGDHFNETYNYSFNSAYQIANFQFSLKKLQEVENPVSIEQKYLRPSLIPNLLKNVEKNLDYFPKIRMFELGKIFYKRSEKKMLTGLIAQKETNAELFYQSKGTVDLLLNRLGISNVWYDEYQPTPEESKISIWHTQKCAEIKTDGQEIGFLGEISPSLLKALKIKAKVAVFDLDFQALKKVALEECEYRPISRFPASVRDLAVLVPKNTKIIEVLNEINTAGGKLIRDIDIFDIYEGEGITENKKNVAFRLIYQSDNKTLTAQEVDEIQNKIMETLGKIPEWEVRK